MALWMLVYKCVCSESLFPVPLGVDIRVKQAAHVGILGLTFWGAARRLSLRMHHFYSHQQCSKSLSSSHPYWFGLFPSSSSSFFFDNSYFRKCEVVSYCDFDLNFRDDIMISWSEHLFMGLLASCISLDKCLSKFLPFLKLVFVFEL